MCPNLTRFILPDEGLLHGVRDGDELGSENVSSLDLSAAVNHPEGPRADLLQNVVVVVHARLSLDVDGLQGKKRK